jgi:prevent-host-death family protein
MATIVESLVGTREVQENLSQLLDRVAQGETITITRDGAPVAKLVPSAPQPPFDEAAAKRAIEEWLELRKGNRLGEGVTIRDLIEEGRRR